MHFTGAFGAGDADFFCDSEEVVDFVGGGFQDVQLTKHRGFNVI